MIIKKVLIGVLFFLAVLVYSKNTRLLIWLPQEPKFKRVYQPLLNKYSEMYKIKIDIEYYSELEIQANSINEAMNNRGPDIIWVINDWLGNLIETGTIADLSSYINKDSFNNSIIGKAGEAIKYKNGIYQIPTEISSLILLYNKELVKNPPANEKDIIEIGKKLQKDGLYGLGNYFIAPYFNVPFLYGYGGKLFTGDNLIALDSDESVDSINFVHNLIYKEKITAPLVEQDALMELFINNKLGMLICGTWELGKIIDSGKIDSVGASILPVNSKTNLPMMPLLSVKGFSVSSTSKNKKEATKLLEYLISKESQIFFAKKTYLVPALKNFYSSADENVKSFYQVFEKQFEQSIPMPNNYEMKYLWAGYSSIIVGNLKSSSTINETQIRETIKSYNDKIVKQRNRKK